MVPVCLMVFGLLCGTLNGEEPAHTDEQRCVVLFTGSGEQNPFWDLFIDFMREAAQDLEIKLEVFYADNSRNRMVSQVREVCERADKPDGIVVQSFKRTGTNILRLAEQYQVPVFLVNSGLNVEEKEQVGEPRTPLRFWIGEMLPDDYGAGYQLANALIDEAKKDPRRLGPDGRVHVIGLNGVVSHEAALAREKGLRKAIDERSDEAVLDQVVAADWDQKFARKRCRFLLRRYDHVSVIWSASDHMAVGAIAAMQDRIKEGVQQTAGKDVIVGGVDATPEAMRLIEQGTMCATVGGHFKEGGWVAVLLHDFFQGVDLAQIPTRFESPMTLVTKDNLAIYQAELDESMWERMDFRQLSRVYSPELKDYGFGAQALSTENIPRDVPFTPSNVGDASKEDDGRNQ